ncbi:MAG: hypothetical protein ABI597_12620 [Gammaproteobacteria bacterium]
MLQLLNEIFLITLTGFVAIEGISFIGLNKYFDQFAAAIITAFRETIKTHIDEDTSLEANENETNFLKVLMVSMIAMSAWFFTLLKFSKKEISLEKHYEIATGFAQFKKQVLIKKIDFYYYYFKLNLISVQTKGNAQEHYSYKNTLKGFITHLTQDEYSNLPIISLSNLWMLVAMLKHNIISFKNHPDYQKLSTKINFHYRSLITLLDNVKEVHQEEKKIEQIHPLMQIPELNGKLKYQNITGLSVLVLNKKTRLPEVFEYKCFSNKEEVAVRLALLIGMGIKTHLISEESHTNAQIIEFITQQYNAAIEVQKKSPNIHVVNVSHVIPASISDIKHKETPTFPNYVSTSPVMTHPGKTATSKRRHKNQPKKTESDFQPVAQPTTTQQTVAVHARKNVRFLTFNNSPDESDPRTPTWRDDFSWDKIKRVLEINFFYHIASPSEPSSSVKMITSIRQSRENRLVVYKPRNKPELPPSSPPASFIPTSDSTDCDWPRLPSQKIARPLLPLPTNEEKKREALDQATPLPRQVNAALQTKPKLTKLYDQSRSIRQMTLSQQQELYHNVTLLEAEIRINKGIKTPNSLLVAPIATLPVLPSNPFYSQVRIYGADSALRCSLFISPSFQPGDIIDIQMPPEPIVYPRGPIVSSN